MVFSSVSFLFLFLPALLFIYFLIPKKARRVRNTVLLLASLGFYAWGEPIYLFIMLGSILLNYAFGLIVSRFAGKSSLGVRASISCAVALNLGVLILFKYADFILQNLNFAFNASLPMTGLIMPIGISFFTFQGMSYVIDVARQQAPVQKNPMNVALYIALFPQLIAGPIVRYVTVADEISCRDENISEFSAGLRRFAVGLAKKVLIANQVGAAASMVFSRDTNTLTASLAWVGAIFFTLQIYFDFSGYSDMAIGLGRMFGFHFLENFDYPYTAVSVTDFWRKWHISLSTFFRDYVYIPLGGNRCRRARRVFNIMAVWLLTGIWHGASWNFILWGLYFGVLLVMEKFVWGKLLSRIPSFFKHIYAMLLVVFGWVIFNTPNISAAAGYFRAMFGFGAGASDGETIYLLLEYGVALFIAIIASFPLKKLLEKHLLTATGTLIANTASLGLIGLSTIYLVASTFNPFIYFRF